jgi:alkanesulfonate monooxygenase SsuD/methylene tetrahydromethanopterin reductase-like flavin-dependent oxidoreductase (luciferase family)
VEAGRDLGTLDCRVSARVSFGDDLEALLAERRPGVAFTLGAMGSGESNFYGEAFHRAGFEAVARDIPARWIAGDRKGAAALVPDEMITGFQLLGADAQVKARIKAYEAAGVTTLKVGVGLDGAGPLGPARFEALERFMDLLGRRPS